MSEERFESQNHVMIELPTSSGVTGVVECMLTRPHVYPVVFPLGLRRSLPWRNKTIFTDADVASANGIAEIFPASVHKLCIWHTMENIKKNGRKHSGELREGVLAEVLRLFKASAYTATQEVSSCDAKEQAYIFIQRGWSFARTMDAKERRYGRTWQNQVEYLFLSFTLVH